MRVLLVAACTTAVSLLLAGQALAGNMTNHGGRVMTSSTTYAIFWLPPGTHFEPASGNPATDAANDARYENLIIRYFQKVSGSDIYATTTQYSGSNGAITNSSTYGGSTTDTNAYPHAGTVADPLTNNDLQNEVDSIRAAQGWPAGVTNEYFMFTGDQIQSCFNSSNCSFNKYCAYHFWFDGSDGRVIWANMPAALSLGGCGGANVTGDNDPVADNEIDVVSHEHLEAVTDPEGDAWYDTNLAGENGDKCVRTYGVRNSIGANIYMGGIAFQVQREWSNAISGCAMSYSTSAPFINQPTLNFSASLTPANIPGNPGDVLAYKLTVSNPSNAEATQNMSIVTTLPAGLTRTGGDGLTNAFGPLGVHDSQTFTIFLTPSSWLLDGSTLTVASTLDYQDILGNGRPQSAASDSTTVVNAQPTLNLPGAQSQDYHDALSFGISANDVNAGDSIALSATGLPAGLTFVDNGDRTGTVSGTITDTPGTYVVTFSADDHHHVSAVTGTVTITVTREETTVTYTGPTVIANGQPVTLSAVLKEDGTTPISGRTMTLSLGLQSCTTGLTDGSGAANCSFVVSGALGPEPISADFAGDTYYVPSSDSATAIVFSFLSHGAFSLGDLTAAAAGPSDTVTWWSSTWFLLNNLTGGIAPDSFKGFAGTFTTSPPSCGSKWTTRGGNSPPPVGAGDIPSYMGVVVPSAVTKSGTTISGNVVEIVVVRTDPGYDPAPGHNGTGTIVAVYCS